MSDEDIFKIRKAANAAAGNALDGESEKIKVAIVKAVIAAIKEYDSLINLPNASD